MAYSRELNSQLFYRQENNENHKEYDDEIHFYDLIAEGNLEEVSKLVSSPKDDKMYEDKGYGHLSDNPLQNAKYHIAISIALVTRYCISHGLDHELAYTLSDVYILKMDRMQTLKDVIRLHGDMLLDYTRHMAGLPKKNVYSLQTVQAINYISANYSSDINVESVAAGLGINRSYLSKLFKANTGKAISDYIRSERLRAAANMLRFSDFSSAEIAEYLHFSSQSHFIQCFKKEMGVTPAEYRTMLPSLYS